jgi:imipenem/basic amino acid-specific outer membrane pore
LTAQAWYYNVSNVADAYWLQADINCQMVPGVKIGAQYAEMSPKAAGDKIY